MTVVGCRRRRVVFALLFAGWASGTVRADHYDRELDMTVGHTQVLSFDRVRRVAVGNGDLADVRVVEDSRQVLLIARQAGVTDMRVWRGNGTMTSFRLRIAHRPVGLVTDELSERLAEVEGVAVRSDGRRVVIEGRTYNDEDTARVAAASKAYPEAVNVVTPAKFTVQGMVRLDVKVLEINRSALTQVGVDWDNAINGLTFGTIRNFHTNPYFNPTLNPTPPALGDAVSGFNANGSASYAGISTRFSSVINLLVQNGLARLLAEPKLSCKSGGEAQFVVGGEVPIPVTNVDGAISVTFKEFGVILKMSPVSDPDGYIATKVDVEVSTIDPSISVLGIPGFATRKTQTEMNVKDGETMVLAGLISSERSKDVEKVPGVGDLPILGELFKSRRFRDRESELVVFVTPRLVGPSSEENQRIIGRFGEMMQTSSEELRFNIMD